jgi:substrate import-associated zinc metallohydrolase lipoprotein
MKVVNKIISFCFLLALLSSCRKEENLNATVPLSAGGDTWAKGPIDKWLYDNLTKPFNIEVKYRWDPWELDLDKTLVPAEESKVIPAMSAIKQIWIEPYSAETGSDLFIKKYAPKEFVLVGSAQYNPNGTYVLGQAEGGNRITMFVINNFDQKDINELRRMLHTIQHEFAHILHQNIMYPVEYKTITGGYTATWFNVSEDEALNMGFITPYAMAGADEDFVEMIATMLVEGKTRFDELVSVANTPQAQAQLRSKEEMVVTYFRQAWNIDFYSLQKRVQNALNNVSPAPNVEDVHGFGKQYPVAGINRANTSQLPQSAPFLKIYDSAKATLDTLGGYGLTMDSVAMNYISATRAALSIYMHNPGGNYVANFVFTYTKDANNIITFTYLGADGNGNLIKPAINPLLNYFINNTFKISWYINPNNTVFWRVVYTPQQMPSAYFVGWLR